MDSINKQIEQTEKTSAALRNASDKQIKKMLLDLATALQKNIKGILAANKKDLALKDPSDPKNDRLMLNESRVNAIAASIKKVATLPNPSGKILEERTLVSGLHLQKTTTPMGVIAAIYESRPNVTFDVAALCMRSQNACILKGSSDATHTNNFSIKLIQKVIKENGLPPQIVTMLPSQREVVEYLFTATRYVDLIIPRGSDALIQYVRKNSLVPVIETGAGVCHVYVDEFADINKGVAIAVNARTSRPSVCNSMDSLLIHKSIAAVFLKELATAFAEKQVLIKADAAAYKLLKGYPKLEKATAKDFQTEFLSLTCAVKIVNDLDAALQHIAAHGTRHSECIVSRNKKNCERFLQEVDAATVYSNASTRFTDGEEFGLGAEIGISTQKLHARGPFALEKLVTEKWILRGSGQIR